MWWRYGLTTAEESRPMVGAKCPKHNAISTNLLEFMGMMITAYMMVVQSDHSNINCGIARSYAR